MTTIAQLAPANSVGAGDLLPLSQQGLLYSVSVAQLTAGLQPLINVPSGDLLGRQSTGAGAPEALAIGQGLALQAGALQATGTDHAAFPRLASMEVSDDIVVSSGGMPGLLPVLGLRDLFYAGSGIDIQDGTISVTVSSIAGPVGPDGPAGAVGAVGPAGPAGPAGAGLDGPTAGNIVSSISDTDYVAIWQNGMLAWMPYGQFLGGQTIDELPDAGPVGDSDQLLVAQSGNALSAQSFGAIWNYLQQKLPSVKPAVIELTANTVLDSTEHNNSLLVASTAITLTANFMNMGAGFRCTLINLAAGSVTMGTGITSGSGITSLPPGASATLIGISFSGGSLIWWDGVTPNGPMITIGSIAAPGLNAPFVISGGIFNDAPSALDYSLDAGTTWTVASSPAISASAYSFTIAGLSAGTYTVRVRDHDNVAVVGVSNSFTVAPPSISISAVPASIAVGSTLTVSGMVSPADYGVQIGLSSSATTAPTTWVNAVVNAGVWSGSLTPSAAGTDYVWAQQAEDGKVNGVSSAITVVVPSISVSVPSTGTAGTALTVSGTVSPAGDSVNVQLATQNSTLPSAGWTAATNSSGNFTAVLTPGASGTYYAWAEDSATGGTAVSAAITISAAPTLTYGINNPGGTYTHGSNTIPLNGTVTPAQDVATSVALSTSNTVLPASGWQSASIINSNSLWAVYYTTPAVAGSYYVWVQTTAGASTVVSSFTVTVT